MHLVLASGSPRRLDLLRELGLDPVVRPPDIDETPLPDEVPSEHVVRLAKEKAAAVFAPYAAEMAGEVDPDLVVVAADTIVTIGGEILGKPADRADAAATLRRLSGSVHEVVSGVAVTTDRQATSAAVRTEVRFAELTDEEIAWYVSTGEPDDKAGSYAMQGRGGVFVESISGSHDNVIGLPRHRLAQMLADVGHPLRSAERRAH